MNGEMEMLLSTRSSERSATRLEIDCSVDAVTFNRAQAKVAVEVLCVQSGKWQSVAVPSLKHKHLSSITPRWLRMFPN